LKFANAISREKHKTRNITEVPGRGTDLLVGERRQQVLFLIQRDGRVLVSKLSEVFSTSPITIRRDLCYLESKGLLERTHGGALAPQSTTVLDLSLKEEEQHQIEEKQAIATAAVKLIKENHCILIGPGTSTTAIARALHKFSNLTIVTNAMNIAIELKDTNFDVILIGGSLRKNSFSPVGPLAEEFLQEMYADILFLDVDAFDPQFGVTIRHHLEARVYRAMVKVSKKVVVICDFTRFNRCNLALIVPPAAIDTLITDFTLSDVDAETLRNSGVKVILA
jgi:DeoR family transcriptional regulator, aga operon transcriptional repressor